MSNRSGPVSAFVAVITRSPSSLHSTCQKITSARHRRPTNLGTVTGSRSVLLSKLGSIRYQAASISESDASSQVYLRPPLPRRRSSRFAAPHQASPTDESSKPQYIAVHTAAWSETRPRRYFGFTAQSRTTQSRYNTTRFSVTAPQLAPASHGSRSYGPRSASVADVDRNFHGGFRPTSAARAFKD